MDPRRRLIAPLLALMILPAACAEAPRPILTATMPVTVLALAPPPQPIELQRLHIRHVVLIECRHGRHGASHKRHACAASAPIMTASTKFAPSHTSAAPQVAVLASVARAAPTAAPPLRHTLLVAAVYSPVAARAWTPTPTPPPTPPPHDHMDGAIKVYAYEAGRVFTVAAAPLRVTTLALQPGESLVDKAAGDTVRWEIGDTTSGSGETARTLVMLKPLTAGLGTNMVLTTSKRVYLLDLSSTAKHGDVEVAWSYTDAVPASPAPRTSVPIQALAAPLGPVNAGYHITPVGRRPDWTPQAVFDDGQRTFIAFAPTLQRGPAPLLFVEDPDGKPVMVNYRQQGDLIVVDRLFTRAELRLGTDHPQVVRLVQLGAGAAS